MGVHDVLVHRCVNVSSGVDVFHFQLDQGDRVDQAVVESLPLRLACLEGLPKCARLTYKGTLLTRKRTHLGPYYRPMSRVLWWS